jgi:RNA polymerase sigma factor (sigma-70 family)
VSSDACTPGADDGPTLTRELLARYLAGDFVAETKLFERHRAALLAKARNHPRLRAVERDVTAEDVVQEVLWRVLSSGMLRSFEDRGRGSLEAALTTILERTLVDTGRRFGARKRGGGDVKVSLDAARPGRRGRRDSLTSEHTTPTSNARMSELVEICERVLEPREREAWTLVEMKGFDAEQTATVLGTSASVVRSLVLRARAKLVRALGDERRGPQ